MLRLELSKYDEDELRRLAEQKQRDLDSVAARLIQNELYRSKNRNIVSILKYLSICFVTSIFVLIGMKISSQSVTWLETPFEAHWRAALHWAKEFVFLFAPWPITILIAFWILSRSESAFWLILGVFGHLRKIKLFGTEIEISEQTRRRIRSASTEIDSAIEEYKKRVDEEVNRAVSRHQIEQCLSKYLDESAVRGLLRKKREGYRCTLFVPDPIRYDRLYQLLNYLPSGDGRGRTFSARYGIIGKVWRTDKAMNAGNLFSLREGEVAPSAHEEKIDKVMSDWGMNRREAEKAIKRLSYFCFPLTMSGTKVGLFYVDSEEADAFDSDFIESVQLGALTNLSPLLLKLQDDLAEISLQINSEKA